MLIPKMFNLTSMSSQFFLHKIKQQQLKWVVSLPSRAKRLGLHNSISHYSSLHSSPVEHIVLVSDSTNIFVNLALEDWIFEHGDLPAKSYLLMWRNSPAIVIGRHQNPWIECNVREARRRNVEIVRRRSGGGAVYHDTGNVNFSFITARSRYNRRANLELVVKAILARWDVDLTLNKRDDLILNGAYKVSGTAAKLSGNKTYHHFTFLLDVNKDNLCDLLQSKLVGVKTKATESVPASVMNVREVTPDMTFDEVISAVGQTFLEHGMNTNNNIQYINPTEETFPGLEKNTENLQSWEWIFEKTPKFSVFRHFSNRVNGTMYNLKINMVIDKGRVHSITLDLCVGDEQSGTMAAEMDRMCVKLTGLRFISDDVVSVLGDIENMEQNANRGDNHRIFMWILTCIKQCF